ncbi:hypothetical protein BaRGS_00002223 [Batillaria attramentaria]|uniref:Uncharacterized protein n=1 Tax=Batillaria attramentaria TaxID=370345 RepID=A0ABD0M6D2_9CAEN
MQNGISISTHSLEDTHTGYSGCALGRALPLISAQAVEELGLGGVAVRETGRAVVISIYGSPLRCPTSAPSFCTAGVLSCFANWLYGHSEGRGISPV